MLFPAAGPAFGQDASGIPRPLPIGSQSPVMGVYGIPKAEGTDITARRTFQWDAGISLTSHFNGTDTTRESILLDGETARFAFQVRYGIDDTWDVAAEVPWVRHGGGFLDGFIINWHDFWGFGQRGRDDLPEDRIDYRYTRDGDTRLNIDSATGGLGDMVLSARRNLASGPGGAAVLHTQVKLPTGDAGKLTGSGAPDIGAGIELGRRWHPDWYSSFRAGAAYLGEGEVLPELQRNWAGYGGLDLVWRPVRSMALRAQFDAHTSPYSNSELKELSDWSGMLTAGGTWYISRALAVDLAVVENIPNANVASDVTFQVRLRTTPGGER